MWRLVTVAVVLAVLARRLTLVARVDGMSMEPALHDGDVIIGLRHVVPFAIPPRDAVILVRVPDHGSRLEVKRVGGIPGDRRTWLGAESGRVIPAGRVYLVGDGSARVERAGVAADSRTYGPIEVRHVAARVLLVVRGGSASGDLPSVVTRCMAPLIGTLRPHFDLLHAVLLLPARMVRQTMLVGSPSSCAPGRHRKAPLVLRGSGHRVGERLSSDTDHVPST